MNCEQTVEDRKLENHSILTGMHYPCFRKCKREAKYEILVKNKIKNVCGYHKNYLLLHYPNEVKIESLQKAQQLKGGER